MSTTGLMDTKQEPGAGSVDSSLTESRHLRLQRRPVLVAFYTTVPGGSPSALDCEWRVSPEQWHARKWPNNAMALSRKEWLGSPNRAGVWVTSGYVGA